MRVVAAQTVFRSSTTGQNREQPGSYDRVPEAERRLLLVSTDSAAAAMMERMRSEDLRSLEQPYPQTGGVRRSSADAFADALGVDVPDLRSLRRELRGDLDDTVGIFGIGWWFPHPGTQRRILISDYLIMASESVETNLIEAKLHYLEALSAWDK